MLKDFFHSLFVPWGSRSRGAFANIYRTQDLIRRREHNEATPPINGEMYG
jgi:hypothetical protein